MPTILGLIKGLEQEYIYWNYKLENSYSEIFSNLYAILKFLRKIL